MTRYKGFQQASGPKKDLSFDTDPTHKQALILIQGLFQRESDGFD